MYAINKNSGAKIKGTLENLQGCANTLEEGFAMDSDGNITHKYEGHTDIYWDNSLTVEQDGVAIYIDEDGSEVPATEVVLVSEDPGS